MPRRRVISKIVLVCTIALAVAGCSGATRVFEGGNEGGLFSKPIDVFAKPDWARPSTANVELGPKGPVPPEELVTADGACALSTEAAPAAAAPAPDRLQGESGGVTPGPAVLGAVSLGMSECQAVRRAGQPSNIAISADERGDRKTVLTYLSGPWPGIYTFSAGRLKVIDRVPEQERPRAPAKKKPASKRTS